MRRLGTALAFLLLALPACRKPNAYCASLDESSCRADSKCVAVGGPELEPMPGDPARCEPGCRSGGLPDACVWTTPTPSPSDATPARVCAGPPGRCQVNHTNTGDYCFDTDPPCAGCKQVFDHCQPANTCSGVICF